MHRSHSERWQSKSLVFCCVYYYLLFLPLLFVWKCCVYCIAFRLITLLCCCLLLSPIRMIYLPICTCLNALPTACPRSSHMCYASWAKKNWEDALTQKWDKKDDPQVRAAYFLHLPTLLKKRKKLKHEENDHLQKIHHNWTKANQLKHLVSNNTKSRPKVSHPLTRTVHFAGAMRNNNFLVPNVSHI